VFPKPEPKGKWYATTISGYNNIIPERKSKALSKSNKMGNKKVKG